MSNESRTPLRRGLVVLMAVASGAAVANIYYAQPLLQTLAGAFRVSDATAGLLVTVTQIGYVLGLIFLVPVGDLRERRGLISLVMVITAIVLAAAAAAPAYAVLLGALGALGFTAVVAQVIVPMSSSLAAEHERGRVVGSVMSGLLLGILLARTVSGLVAAALGWRAVFVVGAVVMVVLAAILRRMLPRVPPTTDIGYGALLRSVAGLIGQEPVLRQRMLMGASGFGCFSVLWTALAFLLAGPPFHYGNAVIGLFGLAGVGGATAATVVGRLADRGHGPRSSTILIGVLVLSWLVLDVGRSSVLALIVGIVLLDLAVQGLHITNQHAIYALDADARSRLTTAYMASTFTGGALLSALTSSLYVGSGWTGVCVLGLIASGVTLVVWVVSSILLRDRSAPVASAATD